MGILQVTPPDIGLDVSPNAVHEHFRTSCPNMAQVVDQAASDLIAILVTTDIFTLHRSQTQRDILVERSYRAVFSSKSESVREALEKGQSASVNPQKWYSPILQFI
jgi:hypothetical protein